MKNNKLLEASAAGNDLFWISSWLRTGYRHRDNMGAVSLPKGCTSSEILIAKRLLGKTTLLCLRVACKSGK